MKSSSSGGSKFGFVRRVLSRTSSRSRSASAAAAATSSSSVQDMAAGGAVDDRQLSCGTSASATSPTSSTKFQSELLLLKSQIESLQISVHRMQTDNEHKERALASATRDKEQLSMDLKKQRRSNANLRQQLEDERNFYYKEKEQYCHEMNSAKKKRLQQDGDREPVTPPLSAQKEISELRNTLNQTLEANYNLSVKFLRMKNTKLELKKQLTRLHDKHEESAQYCKSKMDEFRVHMDEIVHEEFYKPIPPSSKKYLHLLKQNGTLMHENLQLQLDVDRLHAEINRLKYADVRREANSKLKLIHHDICSVCKLKPASNRTNTNEMTTRSVKSRASQTTAILRHSSRSHYSHTSQKSQKSNKSQHSHHRSRHQMLPPSTLSVNVVQIEKHGKLTASTIESTALSPRRLKAAKVQSKYDLMTISNSNIQKPLGECSNSSLDTNVTAQSSIETKSAPDVASDLHRANPYEYVNLT